MAVPKVFRHGWFGHSSPHRHRWLCLLETGVRLASQSLFDLFSNWLSTSRSTAVLLQVAQLADLLEKMLALDPEKRISADSALRHDFIKPFLPKKKPGGKHHH